MIPQDVHIITTFTLGSSCKGGGTHVLGNLRDFNAAIFQIFWPGSQNASETVTALAEPVFFWLKDTKEMSCLYLL